ncbi:MAG: helix-turn-helix domain-containing protein [Micropruina sp.]
MSPATETIHNRISMLRAERGISRRQLADALGVHYQTVGYLERGEYSPRSWRSGSRTTSRCRSRVVFSLRPFRGSVGYAR